MKDFFGNIKTEFKKITWPTDKEMKLNTTQVFVFMIVLSLFFAAVDAIISTGVAAATREPAPIVEEVDESDGDTPEIDVPSEDEADAEDEEATDGE